MNRSIIVKLLLLASSLLAVLPVSPAVAVARGHHHKRHHVRHHRHRHRHKPATLAAPPVGRYNCYSGGDFTDEQGRYYFGFVQISSASAYVLNGSLQGTYQMGTAKTPDGMSPITWTSGPFKDYKWPGYWRVFHEGNGTDTPQILVDGRADDAGVVVCDHD